MSSCRMSFGAFLALCYSFCILITIRPFCAVHPLTGWQAAPMGLCCVKTGFGWLKGGLDSCSPFETFVRQRVWVLSAFACSIDAPLRALSAPNLQSCATNSRFRWSRLCSPLSSGEILFVSWQLFACTWATLCSVYKLVVAATNFALKDVAAMTNGLGLLKLKYHTAAIQSC